MTLPTKLTLEAAFGRAVRIARLESGLSQEELANASRLHRTYVSQIERGMKSPSLDSMNRLANALNLPLERLVRRAAALTATNPAESDAK